MVGVKDAPTLVGSKKNTISPSLFLETTYNVLPQTELGVGMGYIKRKGFDYEAIWRVNNNFESMKKGQNLGKETYQVNRYSSVPVYLTLKQNYPLNQDINAYLKTDLGYSFNKIRNTQYQLYSDIGKNAGEFDKFSESPVDFRVKNGLYVGFSLGIEYKALLAEIGYYHTNSAITVTSQNDRDDLRSDKSSLVGQRYSYKNDALRLSLGFRF